MPSYTLTENTTAQNSSDTPTTGVTEDAPLVQADSSTNFGGQTFFEVSKFGSSDHQHTIIRFDSSSISASETVTSATLYIYHTSNNSEAHNVAVRELLQTGWVEGQTTWDDYATSTAWNTGGAIGSGTDRASSADSSTSVGTTTSTYYGLDVTSTVSSNLGSSLEFHLEMDEAGESGDYMVFASSEGTDGQRPELVIVTTVGGAAPTIGSGYTNSLKLRPLRLVG